MRVAFLGTPAIAVRPLLALHEAGFEIPLVVTGVDKRRGRGSKLVHTPVKAAALKLGLEVAHDLDALEGAQADIGVVVAYGRIIPKAVLDRLAMVNIHFSLLPRWRGAAPVERAILAGDAETGVCLMELAEGLDTGGIYASRAVPIGPADTLESLRETLVVAGSQLLVEGLSIGLGTPVPQVGEPIYAHKLTREEFRLDLGQPAALLDRQIRLGRAWCEFRGKRMRVWSAGLAPDQGLAPGELVGNTLGTGDGSLILGVIQPEGKQRMDATDWLNGAQVSIDERFA